MNKQVVKLAELGLFLVFGIILGIIIQSILGNFWTTLAVGFLLGSIVASLSEHYSAMVKGLVNYLRKPVKRHS